LSFERVAPLMGFHTFDPARADQAQDRRETFVLEGRR